MTKTDVRLCGVAGCGRKYRCSGYCSVHYQRMMTYGRLDRLPEKTLDERFWAKVDASGPCWVWTASRQTGGYGKFMMPAGPRMAHRVAWGLLVGDIAEGYFLDHLCRNPPCVNPDHLDPVLPKENTRRGITAERNRQRWANPTHCKAGHLIAENNLLSNAISSPRRWLCAKCQEGRHGSAALYSAGCRCHECRAARIRYDLERRANQKLKAGQL